MGAAAGEVQGQQQNDGAGWHSSPVLVVLLGTTVQPAAGLHESVSSPTASRVSAAQLSAVRHGNIPLAIQSHTLVLHWNRQAPLLLRQMAANGHGETRTLGGCARCCLDVVARRSQGLQPAHALQLAHPPWLSLCL